MALLDLSEVTKSIIALIHEAFAVSPAWTIAPPSVLPEPPAKVTGEGLGFYLYHVMENKTYSNFPIPGNDIPPVRFLPMALNLYYQLSANSILDDGTGAFNEQLMMGIAMKVLHDYPLVDDRTMINGLQVLTDPIRKKDNRFKIMYQPIPYNEAVNNWTAGAAPIRLSAYYEVSVVFLEPEETHSYTGRVLSYGNYIFPEGQPRITAMQNILQFTVPGQTVPGQVKLQPAQVPPGSSVDLFGSGFGGDSIDLLLLNSRWGGTAIASPGWNPVKAAENRISATVGTKATMQVSGVVKDIIPGMYSAQVQVTRNMTLPSGEIRKFRNVSNQFPFVISPRIDNVNFPPGDIVTVKGYLFQHAELPDDALEAYIGEDRILRDQGGFGPGEFRVTALDTLEIHLPAGLPAGQLLPVRILINGAESPPNWIKL